MRADHVTVLTARDGAVEVECFPTPVPGLVINKALYQDGWNITHRRSGGALLIAIPGPEQALHLAIAMGGVTDWTASGLELRSDPATEERWERVVKAEGAQEYATFGGRIPDAQLAGAGAS